MSELIRTSQYIRTQAEQLKNEVTVYEALAQIPALTDRIPAFYGQERVMKAIKWNLKRTKPCRHGFRLECIPGKTLENSFDVLRLGDIPGIVRTLRKTVELIHEAGVSHNDIWAANIMVRAWEDGKSRSIDDRIVLIDFGRSSVADKPLSEKDREGDRHALDRLITQMESNLRAQKIGQIEIEKPAEDTKPVIENVEPSLPLEKSIAALKITEKDSFS